MNRMKNLTQSYRKLKWQRLKDSSNEGNFSQMFCFRLRLSRVPYLKTTRRGWQGAANGRPTHLAGGMSRLIISLKRYLMSFLLAFYTDALPIIYTLFVLFKKMVHVCYKYKPKHLSYALVWSWVCVLFLSSVHRLSTLTIPLPTSHITHTWLSHLLPPLPPLLLIAWSTNRVMMGWWAKVDSTSQECRCQWFPLGDRVSTRATCLKVH